MIQATIWCKGRTKTVPTKHYDQLMTTCENDDNRQWTSVEADESTVQIRQHIQGLVYKYLREHGPSIHQDIEEYYDATYVPSTIRGCCNNLVKLGWVKPTEQFGLTRAKRRAIIWKAVR